jgi:hypothetical protein
VLLVPAATPVTPDVLEVGVVIVAVPPTTDHDPVPIVGAFPERIKLLVLH